jgi:AcrR family transcriptional regulator
LNENLIKKRKMKNMSPRTKERNSQIKDERREQILLAALKVFSRRGLAATKISDIAEAAHLSNGLVYHYFESKEDVFIELVSQAVELSAAALKEIDAMPLEPLDKIRAIAEQVMKAIHETENSAFYFLLMVQACVSDANPEEVKEIMQKASVPDEIILKIVTEGQKKGCIGAGNAGDYVMLFWAAIQGLALSKIAQGERYEMPNPELLLRMFRK